MKNDTLMPEMADRMHHMNQPQAWASPQERDSAKPGDFPHGLVDTCHDGVEKFHRVWHNPSGTWYQF